MAFEDYSDSYSYIDKIVLEYANELCESISARVITKLEAMTECLQSPKDSGLSNIWQEICVQLQTDYSVMWDLYDATVDDLIRENIEKLPEYALAAVQYSIDFVEQDTDFVYNLEEIISEIKSKCVYSKAMDNHEKSVDDYIEAGFEMD